MTKSKKRMAVAAIAAVGCLAGVLGLRAPESESQSALTIANIEALTSSENEGKYKCYSSLVAEEGASVVDCSTCTSVPDMSDAWYCIHDFCYR